MVEVDDSVGTDMVADMADHGDPQDSDINQALREDIEDEDHSVEDIEEHTVGDINLGLST